MTDLHARILATICEPGWEQCADALRAVVELHRPIVMTRPEPTCLECAGPEDERLDREPWCGPYPCDTIAAVARGLHIEPAEPGTGHDVQRVDREGAS